MRRLEKACWAFALVLLVAVIIGIFSARAPAAETWRPFVDECGQAVETSPEFTGKNPGWRPVFECVAQRASNNRIPPAAIDACEHLIDNARIRLGPKQACAACGDWLAMAMQCLGAD